VKVTLQQQQVLRNTYLLLALSLIPTGIGALIGVNLTSAHAREPDRLVALLLAVIYGMFFAIEKNRNSGSGRVAACPHVFPRHRPRAAAAVAIGLRNGGQLIALGRSTAAVFFAMAGIATRHRKDFGFMGNFLAVAASCDARRGGEYLLASPALYLTICAVFVLFSSGW